MRAMVLDAPGCGLSLQEIPRPVPAPGQLLIRVHTCGVCRTDLHVLDGDLDAPKRPVVPGHQIVGRVAETAPGLDREWVGRRVGVPWLGGSCGTCRHCTSDHENLCDRARYTGYQIDGGFAEYAVADADFCFELPETHDDLHAAPLLCAGLIGHRAYRMVGDARRIGLYGFGASAHILIQVAVAQGREVSVFTRPGDTEAADFARRLGAHWVGGSTTPPAQELDAAILFAPVGDLVPLALAAVGKGGSVVCAGIHMSDIPSFPYSLLWGERTLRSVANLTRRDGEEFFALVRELAIECKVQSYPLEETGRALEDLRRGNLTGAAVIQVAS